MHPLSDLAATSGHAAIAPDSAELSTIASSQSQPLPSLIEAGELCHEQLLNQLTQRLQQQVTAALTELLPSQGEETISQKGTVSVLLEVLSQGLEGETVFFLQSQSVATAPQQRPGVNPLEDSAACRFSTAHATTDLTSPPQTQWGDKVVCLTIGATLPTAIWENWQASLAGRIWSLMTDPDEIGWLLVCPAGWLVPETSAPAGDGQVLPLSQAHQTFIERSIAQWHLTGQQMDLLRSLAQQQQKLATTNRELTQSNRLKSEFLANTSHEIRTPLSSILGFTHLLQAQGYQPANLRHQEYLNIILTSGQHLLALINDILDLSKIEANQLDLQWDTIDIRELCQVALTLVREKAGDKGLKLQLEIAPPVTTIVADGLRLKQMLFNLLSNAVKFTACGSVGIQVTYDQGQLRFTVWDTGTGISQASQQLLFKPYAQLSNAVTARGEGTGLGLALTQKLAELHGGWVEVNSVVDRGSRFTICLPPVPPACSAPDTTPPSPPEPNFPAQPKQALTPAPNPTRRPARKRERSTSPPLPGAHPRQPVQSAPLSSIAAGGAGSAEVRPNQVLLVEDNIHNAKLMLAFLSKSGYEVTWVQDGREMWQVLEQFRPALILMDIHLPEVDGLSLIQQLQQDDRLRSIPVIAQTALAMKGDRDLCLEAGAVDYISKPIDLAGLIKLVAKHVGERSD